MIKFIEILTASHLICYQLALPAVSHLTLSCTSWPGPGLRLGAEGRGQLASAQATSPSRIQVVGGSSWMENAMCEPRT